MDLSQRKSDEMNLWAIVCCLMAVCFLSGFGVTNRFCLWHRIFFSDGRSASASGVASYSSMGGRLMSPAFSLSLKRMDGWLCLRRALHLEVLCGFTGVLPVPFDQFFSWLAAQLILLLSLRLILPSLG
ncbi:hypothetical protein F2Q69_00053796 [Brassica cretica]|uniref:Uncharacterized protein n=1 Tax=Brassica cretica TaxID=69181 RepID=A0A8S9MY73_BRACR|nr:hypothetical protein F2Q69_00053796 [Brassica cretica]